MACTVTIKDIKENVKKYVDGLKPNADTDFMSRAVRTVYEGKIEYHYNYDNIHPSGSNTLYGKMIEVKNIINNHYGKNEIGVVRRYPSGVTLTVTPTIKLAKEMTQFNIEQEVKLQEQEYENTVLAEDAERAGVEVSERQLFDDLLSSNSTSNYNGFNYINYVARKLELKKKIEKRKSILENRSKKTKADLVQIEELKEVIRKLNKDAVALSSTPAILKNYFEYFEKDMSIIKDLLERPTLENLTLVQSYIDTIDILTSDKDGGFLQETLQDIYNKTQDKYLVEAFYEFRSNVELLKDTYKIKEREIIEQEIVKYLKNKKESGKTQAQLEAKAIRLYETQIEAQLKDIGDIAAYLNTSDSVEDNLLNSILTSLYNDSISDSKRKDLRVLLSEVKPKLIAELKKLGHTNKTSILGKLFNPVNYNIFKRKSEDGTNRLIGKFSNAWTSFKKRTDRDLQKIRALEFTSGKTLADYGKIHRLKNDHYKLLDDNTEFFDVTRVPEFLADPELAGNNFASQQEADDYKKKVIADIGEREYNKIVKAQREAIYSYQIALEQYELRLLKEYGQSSIDQIPEAQRNQYLDYYYTKSPFIFNETRATTGNKVKKVFYQNGTPYINDEALADMEFINTYPKTSVDRYYDDVFKNEIETNPTLLEAWGYMAEATNFINTNGHNYKNDDVLEDSLIHQRNMFQANLGPGKNMFSLLSEKTLQWMNEVFTTSRYVDKTKMEIGGQIKTIDQVVSQQLSPIMTIMRTKFVGLETQKAVLFDSLPTSVKEFISERSGKDISEFAGKNASIEAMIREGLSEKIGNEQDLDLIESLTSQVDVVEKFKARKEIEIAMNFIMNKIRTLKDETETGLRNKTIDIAEFFMEKQLYGVNNRANFVNLFSIDDERAGSRKYTQEEKEVRTLLQEAKEELQAACNSAPPDVQEEIKKEIAAIDKALESGGRVVTTGSIIEATVLKLARYKAFALNFSTQLKNSAMGNFNSQEVDGMLWTEGNIYKANAYLRRWNSSSKNRDTTNLLLNRLEVFQNSANEIFKVEKSIYKGSVAKVLANPMQLPGEIEKTIQRPQILSLLADLNIKDKNGNEVSVFDANNRKNPHPAFQLSAEGSLELRPEFATEENTATWILNNSQEYANLFGDSGKIPKAIAFINGDYRDSSSYLLEKTMAGTLVFMFKRWLPATLNKKFGVYKTLIKNNHHSSGNMIITQTALLYGLNVGTLGAGGSLLMAAGIGLYASKVGREMHKQAVKEDISVLHHITKSMVKALMSHQFYLNNIRIAGAGVAKAAQLVVNPIAGTNVIKNETLNKIAGFNNLQGTPEQIEESKKNLQFLMTSFAKTLIFTAMRIAVHAALFPDDDEKKEYNRNLDKSFKTRLTKYPDTTLFYIFENTISSLQDDVNLILSPTNLTNSVIPFQDSRSVNNLIKFSTLIDSQNLNGDYQSGENAGKNRIAVGLHKLLVPNAYDNFSLGFNSSSKRDFAPKDYVSMKFTSDFAKFDSTRLQYRSKAKQELIESLEDEGFSEEQITSIVNKRLTEQFPSIKKYFNLDGSMIEGYEAAVEDYK